MGMPISNYSILRAFWDKNASSYEQNIANSIMSKFKLFAFIIYDPEIHIDFANFLQNKFDQLDYLTGNDFLFLALVDPPSSWLETGHKRKYYREYENWEIQELRDPSKAIVSKDKSLTANSLARILNIRQDDLPCIIVTNDLGSTKYQWFKTCSIHLEQQMQTLGYIASRNQTGVSAFNHVFDEKRELIDLCNGVGINSLDVSIAKTLTEFLSFIIASSSNTSFLCYQSTDHVESSLAELFTTLNKLKQEKLLFDSEVFDNLCVKIATFQSLLNTRSTLDQQSFIPIKNELLEIDSISILKTTFLVYDLLNRRHSILRNQLHPEFLLDFTPALICLTKLFEREANLSIVHWVRNKLGIDLPEYYNKYEPEKAALLRSGDQNINFNMKRDGKWLPPGMGQSENACRLLSLPNPPELWDNTSWNILMENWKILREKRNEAAHIERVDFQSMEKVKNSMINLTQNKIFEKFYQMKMQFSGRENIRQ